ncbi:hypothetical protein ElyMa_002153200 [Elysia marginata]|uniref:Uncharacterized protein n=1 Tax=Elysia marginata TaxID=1093978 RepID=A0AAV4FLH1_9GAST|nr:hypothetical protein ElyMa_002153200 [Elysia marginata]
MFSNSLKGREGDLSSKKPLHLPPTPALGLAPIVSFPFAPEIRAIRGDGESPQHLFHVIGRKTDYSYVTRQQAIETPASSQIALPAAWSQQHSRQPIKALSST